MKMNCVLFALMAAGAASILCVFPPHTYGQSEMQVAQIDLLLEEINQQQIAITKNQAIIDEKLAAINEDLQVARIFVSRAGGLKQ